MMRRFIYLCNERATSPSAGDDPVSGCDAGTIARSLLLRSKAAMTQVIIALLVCSGLMICKPMVAGGEETAEQTPTDVTKWPLHATDAEYLKTDIPIQALEVGQRRSISLILKNETGHEFEVLSASRSCSCTQVKVRKQKVPVGESFVVDIVVDIDVSESSGRKTIGVRLATAGKLRFIELELTADVKGVASFLEWGPIFRTTGSIEDVGTDERQEFRIPFRVTAPITLAQVSLEPQGDLKYVNWKLETDAKDGKIYAVGTCKSGDIPPDGIEDVLQVTVKGRPGVVRNSITILNPVAIEFAPSELQLTSNDDGRWSAWAVMRIQSSTLKRNADGSLKLLLQSARDDQQQPLAVEAFQMEPRKLSQGVYRLECTVNREVLMKNDGQEREVIPPRSELEFVISYGSFSRVQKVTILFGGLR